MRKVFGGLLRALALAFVFVLLLLAVIRLLATLRETDRGRPVESRRFETPLGGVTADVSGPANGPPILLVPGTAAWSGFWRDVASHLAGRGWRVIAVDLPPFGYSDHDPDARYDRISQARRLVSVLQATARRPAIVVGHSFGAGAATELALRNPALVDRLVLVDAALGVLDPQADGKGIAEQLLALPIVAQPLTAATLTNPAAIAPLLRSMIARKPAADSWLETLRAPMRRTGTTGAYAAWLPALFARNDGAYSRRSDRLRAIRPSVALIWGSADTVTPVAQGERIAALAHARSFIRLPGVGHIPHIEDPQHFLAALDISIDDRKDSK